MACAVLALQAMASMETSAPVNRPFAARRSSKSGIVSRSQLAAPTASWASTSFSRVAKAETRCGAARPLPRSWLPREVLPSIATSAGASGRSAAAQDWKQSLNRSRSIRFIRMRSQRAPGMPW
jgi:hypothetical protein